MQFTENFGTMLYVFPNLEMGDNIVLNGLCRFLARREEHVKWVARRTYAEDIARMFSDLPNVEVIDGYDYPEARAIPCDRALRLGFFGPEGVNWRTVQWDEEFYRQAGVDFEERWAACNFPADMLPPLGIPSSGCRLVHQVVERDFVLRPGLIPRGARYITKAGSFWDWLVPICCAAEFHCVDSSYLNLAESLYAAGYLRNTKLVFHAYSKIAKHGSVPPVLRAPWEVLT